MKIRIIEGRITEVLLYFINHQNIDETCVYYVSQDRIPLMYCAHRICFFAKLFYCSSYKQGSEFQFLSVYICHDKYHDQ